MGLTAGCKAVRPADENHMVYVFLKCNNVTSNASILDFSCDSALYKSIVLPWAFDIVKAPRLAAWLGKP